MHYNSNIRHYYYNIKASEVAHIIGPKSMRLTMILVGIVVLNLLLLLQSAQSWFSPTLVHEQMNAKAMVAYMKRSVLLSKRFNDDTVRATSWRGKDSDVSSMQSETSGDNDLDDSSLAEEEIEEDDDDDNDPSTVLSKLKSWIGLFYEGFFFYGLRDDVFTTPSAKTKDILRSEDFRQFIQRNPESSYMTKAELFALYLAKKAQRKAANVSRDWFSPAPRDEDINDHIIELKKELILLKRSIEILTNEIKTLDISILACDGGSSEEEVERKRLRVQRDEAVQRLTAKKVRLVTVQNLLLEGTS